MNPKDFSWDEAQQVTVINPTKQDFKFKVYNNEYEVKAGTRARMPGYIAWMYVYHLATKMCQADNKFGRWNEEGFRQTYFEKLVDSVEGIMQEVPVEPEKIETVEDKPKIGRPPTPKS